MFFVCIEIEDLKDFVQKLFGKDDFKIPDEYDKDFSNELEGKEEERLSNFLSTVKYRKCKFLPQVKLFGMSIIGNRIDFEALEQIKDDVWNVTESLGYDDNPIILQSIEENPLCSCENPLCSCEKCL